MHVIFLPPSSCRKNALLEIRGDQKNETAIIEMLLGGKFPGRTIREMVEKLIGLLVVEDFFLSGVPAESAAELLGNVA